MEKYLNHQLDSGEIPVALGEYNFDKPAIVEEKYARDKIHFTFGVNGTAHTELFNAASDFDKENPDTLLGIEEPALIIFDPSHAWLKYSAEVGIKTESGIDVNNFGFGFSADRKISSSVYRKHLPTEKLEAALLSDATNFKSIFSSRQIKSLDIGEGVSLSFGGTIQASIKVKWSDVVSAGLSSFNSIITNLPIIKIRMGAEMSAGFTIKIEDSFNVFIARKSKSVFTIHIKKNKTSTKGASIGAKLGAEVENSEEFANVLTRLVEGLIGEPESRVKKIIEKASSKLSEDEKKIIDQIADRFGWEGPGTFNKLKDNYEKIKTGIGEKLIALSESKVQASARYDYNRIDTRSVLFSAEINEEGIEKFHRDLLKMKVDTLQDSVRKKENLLKNATFLNTDILEVNSTTGFSIGFGKWKASTEKDRKFKIIEQENETGKRKVAYDSKRSYTDAAFNDSRKRNIDLCAETPDFTSSDLANAFDYSLFLGWQQQEKKISSGKLAKFLDMACVWGIIPEPIIEEKTREWTTELRNTRNVQLSCEFRIDHLGFEMMLRALAKFCKEEKLVAKALAKALPPWDAYVGRNDIKNRTELYAPLWLEYLQKGSPYQEGHVFANSAYWNLKGADKKLAEAERDYKKGITKFDSFGFILNTNPNTRQALERLASGFERLANGNDAKSTLSHKKVVQQAFEDVESFWRHSHHFKTLGVILAMTIDDLPLVKPYVSRTLQIKFKDKNGMEQVELIGQSSES